MRNKHRQMKLSHEEDNFLRHWIHDEAHYEEEVGCGQAPSGPALYRPGGPRNYYPAAIPDLNEQEAAAFGPPPVEPPVWPWSDESFRSRLDEAKGTLASAEK